MHFMIFGECNGLEQNGTAMPLTEDVTVAKYKCGLIVVDGNVQEDDGSVLMAPSLGTWCIVADVIDTFLDRQEKTQVFVGPLEYAVVYDLVKLVNPKLEQAALVWPSEFTQSNNVKAVFLKIANELIADGVNWSSIVEFLCFATAFANSLDDEEGRDSAKFWAAGFIQGKMLPWILEQEFGWDSAEDYRQANPPAFGRWRYSLMRIG